MKYKPGLLTTIAILTIFLFLFLIDIDKYIPNFSKYLPFAWIFLLIFDIYKSKKYLKSKPENEIRIRSNNDGYLNIRTFILGLISFGFSIFFFIKDAEKTIIILPLILGILLVFKGIFFIPSALIKNENGKLYFENGKELNSIDTEEVEEIIFNENNIKFKLYDNKNYIFSHLELNQSEIEIAKVFFKENNM